jgi:opacity protein-like surface antigen
MCRTRALILGLLLFGSSVSANATEWAKTATLYGWLPGVSTNLDSPFGIIDGGQSASSVLESLDFAFFGRIDVSNGTWGVLGDLAYADLEFSPSIRNVLFRGTDVGTQLVMASMYGTYQFYDTSTVVVEGAAGLRYYDLDLSTDLEGILIADVSWDIGAAWTDIVIGGRATAPISDRWTARVFGDIGGFGIGDSSDLSWEFVGTLSYVLSDRWSMQIGYRHLSIKQEIDGIDAKVGLSGPVIGASASF